MRAIKLVKLIFIKNLIKQYKKILLTYNLSDTNFTYVFISIKFLFQFNFKKFNFFKMDYIENNYKLKKFQATRHLDNFSEKVDK